MFAQDIFGNIQERPYRHLYEADVFAPEIYREMLANRPDVSELRQIGEVRGAKMKQYPERFAFLVGDGYAQLKLPAAKRKFWRKFTDEICRGEFARALLAAFKVDRTGMTLGNEIYLVRDVTKYALGPHTDHPSKVVSCIFYLAEDANKPQLGTSVYVPNDPSFTDPKGTHHVRGGFRLHETMPYVPNSMFAFRRTDNSFHGVEPVSGERWLLLYDIHKRVNVHS
jgi:hypothetical protein